jgi:hypothetical protein
MTEPEVYRYRCADGTVVVQSDEYPTLFYVDGLPALACTLAFWREQRGGPLVRVLEVSS